VVADPTSGWTAEGSEIDVSDPDIDELNVVPKKLAALVVVSNELIADSDPSALQVVGDGLVRDLQVRGHAVVLGVEIGGGLLGTKSSM
jgi:HK97 family phage major capsid protein